MSRRAPLPAAAWWLGAVSFVNDAASEMVLPLLPTLLTGTLGAPAEVLGAIEGTASAVASVLKLLGGRLADRTGRHGALVIGGYALSNILRPLMALASTPLAVLLLRIGDRVGKGLRTAPRDALLSAATPPEAHAAAYSVHRALDHAGTILGALVAAYAIHALGLSTPAVFGWSVVPGVVVIVLVVLAVRATQAGLPAGSLGGRAPAAPAIAAAPAAPAGPLPAAFYVLLGLMTLSRLGLASELFLLLFAGRFVPLWGVPLLWALLHVVKSAASFGAAPLGSRLGPKPMVVLGWVVHAAVFAGFALAAVRWNATFAGSAATSAGAEATRAALAAPAAVVAIVGLFLTWGLYAGLSEGAEKALVAARSEPRSRGTAFGLFHMVTGLVALPASLIFGWLWDHVAPAASFGFGALCAAAAVALLLLFG